MWAEIFRVQKKTSDTPGGRVTGGLSHPIDILGPKSRFPCQSTEMCLQSSAICF